MLRVKLKPEQTIELIINAVNTNLIEGQEHQDLPFEMLVESMEIERS